MKGLRGRVETGKTRAHAFFDRLLPGLSGVFTPSRQWQRFCSASCRSAARHRTQADKLRELLARALPDDPGRPE